ncbi:MAG: hypothetical protein SPH02_03290, partial [Campylobacter sp.]|nr:hypothetical protein [Campylobacter sp.]
KQISCRKYDKGPSCGRFLKVLDWAAQHLKIDLFHRFPAAFALKNWHKTRSNATATVLHG